MNKSLLRFLEQGAPPQAEYSLQMVVQSLRSKCERLIEIENYLTVKAQLLNRVFQKRVGGNPAEEASLGEITAFVEKLKADEEQAAQSLLQQISGEKERLSLKERQVEGREGKLKELIDRKKE